MGGVEFSKFFKKMGGRGGGQNFLPIKMEGLVKLVGLFKKKGGVSLIFILTLSSVIFL